MKSLTKADYKLNYFNFENTNDKYLITNDLGRFLFIDKNDMKNIIEHNFNISENVLQLLEDNYFIYKDRDDFIEKASNELSKMKNYLNGGTKLHIFVLTTFCNLSCIYCQASAKNNVANCEANHKFMSKEIAKKAVDIALQSPSMNLTFEFQGGEPLANFEVLKYIVNYSKERNKELEKNICYSMVSNLTLLDEEMIDFILENNIGLSTSIDGPEDVHNVNRKYNKGNSLEITKSKIKQINNKANSSNIVQAIQTTSKFSLNYPKEIVDEYVSLGLKTIFVRPLTPMGYAAKYWGEFGYTADEYLNFYEKTLDYIIELALKGINISEANAVIFLKKILNNDPINYMELRSPCGGAIGQLAYNYDGNIYTCDEGRMLAEMGDESFKLGNVFENNLKDLIKSPVCKTVAVSSCLEAIPGCEQCVYSPYCGVCPVCNYAQYGNLFAPNINSYRCRIYKGMLEILFKKIQQNDRKVIDIFNNWIK